MDKGESEVLEKNAAKDEHGKDIVSITVDGKECRIHRGRRSVAEIKEAGKVPLADELSQIIDGKITPLTDDGSVVIKGHEVFVSNKRSGGSSWK